ncbi:MAG: PDZ domain-containing protein [Deltaproteobacteria bacterium]|nr:PDZ domain-containing protein [Deltaproteobacteria bacterium]
MKKKTCCLLVTFTAFLCLLLSCGSDSGSSISDTDLVVAGQISYTAEECSIEGQNDFVYRVMTDTYLWYDTVPQIDLSLFDSPEDLLENIRYSELDRWSYIADQDDYYSFYEEGRYVGLGFSMINTEGEVLIMYVFNDSPADQSEMERGDRILAINEKTVEEIETNGEWDTIFGEDTVGVKVDLVVEKQGSTQTLSLTKDWVNINTVLYHGIIENEGVKIGYIMFKSFLMTSLDELTTVFTQFKEEGVEELILDLRYNGGGRSVVAKYLADLIGGENTNGKIFQKFIHNDRHANWNNSISFSEYSISLDLERVIVIATGSTASASEMVINGLKPFIDVVVIGDTTSGKPVGMYGHDFCDKHISLIEFKIANADDEGDYFSGIDPDCISDDDFTKQLGDAGEDSLKEALYYIACDECSEGRSYTSAKRQMLTNKKKTRKQIRRYGLKGEIGAF